MPKNNVTCNTLPGAGGGFGGHTLYPGGPGGPGGPGRPGGPILPGGPGNPGGPLGKRKRQGFDELPTGSDAIIDRVKMFVAWGGLSGSLA